MVAVRFRGGCDWRWRWRWWLLLRLLRIRLPPLLGGELVRGRILGQLRWQRWHWIGPKVFVIERLIGRDALLRVEGQ
jgi:hypothetical protein